FKLRDKVRHGAHVTKHYDAPQTPCARLLASEVVPAAAKEQLRAVAHDLDPLQLLSQIRHWQQQLAVLADRRAEQPSRPQQDSLTRFLAGLATAWREGEVRPTHGAPQKPARHWWRTRKDPLEAVWAEITEWLKEDPDSTGTALLQRLQVEHPHEYTAGNLRTLQRRLKAWRSRRAHEMVFGAAEPDEVPA
ncbi:MAG TPA: ISNCY family transposase, partial [Nevskiaceae bacterium]